MIWVQNRVLSHLMVLATILTTVMPVSAQMTLPEVLSKHLQPSEHNDLYSNSIFKELKESSTERIWKVWSDREENPLYNSFKGNESNASARWMEEFEVMDIKKSPNGDVFLKVKSPRKSLNMKEGWIPLSRTLATSKALANDFGLTQKYMILTPLENFKRDKKKVLNARFYSGPDEYARSNGNEVNRFTILFVLKIEEGRVLLSTSNDFSQLSSGRTGSVSGWFPKEALTPWENRIGYAPNHGNNLATGVNGTLPVHKNEAQAKKYWESRDISNSLTTYNVLDAKPENWNAAFPPMPNITKRRSNDASDFKRRLREVIVLVCAGSARDCETDYNTNRSKLESLQKQLEQLNVYFILDGTNSMEPFIQSARNAIEEIVAFLEEDGDLEHLSLGYTVYRDYPDKKFAVVPSRPSNDTQQFLKEIEAINCFSNASTRAEAFYQGLITGIQTAEFNSQFAQNILIVIGDAGNHIDDKLRFADVETLLADKQITLFGFQTNNGAHSSYMDFTQDLIQIASLGNNSGKWVEESESKFTLQSSSEKKLADWETESSIYIGNSRGEPTNPNDLSRDIVHAIKKVNAKKDRLKIQLLQSDVSGKNLPNTKIDVEFGGVPASAKGFIIAENTSNNSNEFVPYVFLLDEEFNKLQNAFRQFSNSTSPASNTKEFTEILLAIMGSITGDDLQTNPNENAMRQIVLQKTLSQIWLDYLQVPCELPFADVKLQDLNLAYQQLGRTYEKAVEEFKDQADTFSGLTNKTKLEWKPVLGIANPFYWVPFSLFPGAE